MQCAAAIHSFGPDLKLFSMKHLVFFLCVLFGSLASANIVGSDLENFNPTTDGLGYITVDAAETLPQGRFNFGAFLDYTYNVLPLFDVDSSDAEPDDRILTSNIHLAYGLVDWWTLGVSITTLQDASTNAASFAAQFSNSGDEAIRLSSKFRLIRKKSSALTALLGVNFNQINNNPYLGVDPGPSFLLGVSYEQYISKTLRWAFNLG